MSDHVVINAYRFRTQWPTKSTSLSSILSCPWTGTAIGKNNMGSFQMFVGLVFICLIMDIFLLTAGAMM